MYFHQFLIRDLTCINWASEMACARYFYQGQFINKSGVVTYHTTLNLSNTVAAYSILPTLVGLPFLGALVLSLGQWPRDLVR